MVNSSAVLMFIQLQCCGVNNYTDWYNIAAWPNEERVPPECCRVDKCPVKDHPEEWYQEVSTPCHHSRDAS